MLKWIGRLTIVGVVILAAEYYSSTTVLSRITEFQETLIAPDGRRFVVSKTSAASRVRRPTVASIVSTESVPFGYRVTYTLPTRRSLACTYRLPGVSCEDGWNVIWSQRAGSR